MKTVPAEALPDIFSSNVTGEYRFRTTDVCGRLYLQDTSSPLVISFSNAGEVVSNNDLASGLEKIWGYDFLKSQNLNSLCFSCIGLPNWYRADDFHNFLIKIASSLDYFETKLGYGGSMGGYAVAAFSEILNLDRMLLMNPISTLNRDLVPFEKRFVKARTLNWDGRYHDSAQSEVPGILVYDPLFDLDTKHAVRYKNLTHFGLPGVGHSMPKHLKEMGMLSYCFKSLVSNHYPLRKFKELSRARRRYHGYYEWMLSPQNKHLTPIRKKILEIARIKNIANFQESSITRYEVDKVRDIAFNLYKIGEYKKSYDILVLLNKLRPEGSGIKKILNASLKKVNER